MTQFFSSLIVPSPKDMVQLLGCKLAWTACQLGPPEIAHPVATGYTSFLFLNDFISEPKASHTCCSQLLRASAHAAQVEDVVCCGRGRLWPCPPQRRQFRGSQCAEVANAPVPCFHGDVKKWINLSLLVLL